MSDAPRIGLTVEQQRAYLAHVDGTCPGCADCDEDMRWQALWAGPTQAEMDRVARNIARVAQQSYLAEARQRYGIHPSWSDQSVSAFLDLLAYAPRQAMPANGTDGMSTQEGQ